MSRKTTIIMIDTSGSMNANARADSVSQAMKRLEQDVFPSVLAENKNPDLVFYVGVCTFCTDNTGDKIEWVVDPNQTKMENFMWTGLPECNGGTPTGAAILEVLKQFSDFGPTDLAPSILLISDGEPNGDKPTYDEALEQAQKNPIFRRSNRIAIGVAVDEDGKKSLTRFGRLSSSLRNDGYEPYITVTDEPKVLIEAIKRATMGLSQEVPKAE